MRLLRRIETLGVNLVRRAFTVENGKGKALGRRCWFPRNKPFFAIVDHVINFDVNTKLVRFWKILLAGTERAY